MREADNCWSAARAKYCCEITSGVATPAPRANWWADTVMYFAKSCSSNLENSLASTLISCIGRCDFARKGTFIDWDNALAKSGFKFVQYRCGSTSGEEVLGLNDRTSIATSSGVVRPASPCCGAGSESLGYTKASCTPSGLCRAKLCSVDATAEKCSSQCVDQICTSSSCCLVREPSSCSIAPPVRLGRAWDTRLTTLNAS
eukprot:4197489-Amphidinium_carterae.1